MTYYTFVSKKSHKGHHLRTYWDEEVGNLLLVALPGLAVLATAPVDIPISAVDNHGHEEDRIEPREWTPVSVLLVTINHTLSEMNCSLESSNETPGHGEEHVRNIIRLSDDGEPAIDHDVVACIGLNRLGILNSLPWHLGESVALNKLSLLLVTEGVLLAVGTVPHPVKEDVQDGVDCQGISVPVILRWVMVGQIKRTMAIGEWHTGHIPKGEHESEFLIIHIPVEALDLQTKKKRFGQNFVYRLTNS